MTICPNCSASAIGNEVASVCTECRTAAVAGASLSLPAVALAALAAGCLLLAARELARVFRPRGIAARAS
ncbi:MAG: hypothetical protein AAFR38_10730 [Planctomycetota bacterium]